MPWWVTRFLSGVLSQKSVSFMTLLWTIQTTMTKDTSKCVCVCVRERERERGGGKLKLLINQGWCCLHLAVPVCTWLFLETRNLVRLLILTL